VNADPQQATSRKSLGAGGEPGQFAAGLAQGSFRLREPAAVVQQVTQVVVDLGEAHAVLRHVREVVHQLPAVPQGPPVLRLGLTQPAALVQKEP
jgi:hypothetical protein